MLHLQKLRRLITDGSIVVLIYSFPDGKTDLKTLSPPNALQASCSFNEGTTMHISPVFQFAGVATLW